MESEPVADRYLTNVATSWLSLYAQPEQYRNFQMAYKKTVPVFLIKECFK